MIKLNDTYSETITFSEKMINDFIQISRDDNPIHQDSEAAKKAGYPTIIVPSMLPGSIFGGIFGSKFPGYGSINLWREFTFIRPVFIGIEYTILFKATEIDANEHIGTIKCRLKDANSKICIECTTRIKNTYQFVSV